MVQKEEGLGREGRERMRSRERRRSRKTRRGKKWVEEKEEGVKVV